MGTVHKIFEVADNLVSAPQKEDTAVSISSGTVSINPNTSRFFVVNANANITTFNITTPKGSMSFEVVLDFSGSYSVNGFPASVKWVGSETPAFSGANNEEIILVFHYFESLSGFRADATAPYSTA